MLNVDKRRPIRHYYKNHTLIIKFNWKKSNANPESAVVLCEEMSGKTVVLALNGPWPSFDRAMTEAVFAAEFWVNKQNTFTIGLAEQQ
ncbi:hypothetical protein [Pseudomonas sp. PDM25]|uniref:hypothetical protein n=1 Tax=Pseudomonas sp. PDM25 TaxID=2854772 RepID=UPI001C467FFD|nr:hypothetical protein [Pseudomonas sp. PDM25]MBV7515677.1 hypothetical protein [Pseudomonas sp. PDM25]